MQQTYLSVKPVYKLLGAEGDFRLIWRMGSHQVKGDVLERYFDWCDKYFFGADHVFPERMIHPWDWES